ncbi:hypothetical protein FQN54_001331 [Arachnomyces sp. PD_36]|nr:hypothetical protein FQN54_001331 [Arachnomyces sp. PD_36]
MSLYFDAVTVLTDNSSHAGSFVSRIYNAKNIKSPPSRVVALIFECAKFDIVLKEVVENAGILPLEPKLTPLLSILLVHDLLLAKKGITTPANHALRLAVERHKARLKAEFVKARLRRKCATVEELRIALAKERVGSASDVDKPAPLYPRWVRINNVVSSLESELKTTFSAYKPTPTLAALSVPETRDIYIDEHIPDLVAVSANSELTSSQAYKKGQIILQDKASCFPAYLLLGNPKGEPWKGDIIDACAAPGNKTTHLTSILSSPQQYGKSGESGRPKIFSMDSSAPRSQTLQKMVTLAGADEAVTVLPRQDFLATKTDDQRFQNVTALLLDPSCSGSGIVGRDDTPKLALPNSGQSKTSSTNGSSRNSKKRKRNQDNPPQDTGIVPPTEESDIQGVDRFNTERLTKLSNLQLHIIVHAFGFPAATRITYSTCSIHIQENESVVARALASDVARRRGWRILRREEQVEGLWKWKHRGIENDGTVPGPKLSDEERDATIRCWPDDEEGSGGFFVAGFVRDDSAIGHERSVEDIVPDEGEDENDDEVWEGFGSD